VLEIAGQRRADIIGKGQPFMTLPLAAHHKLTCPPVDVVQLKASDLTSSQAEPGQQQQDR